VSPGDRTGRWLGAFVLASALGHAAAFGSLGRERPAAVAAPRPPALVTMEVVPRPPPPPEVGAPPPAAPPPPRRVVARTVAVRSAAAPPAPVPAAPPPADPPVADFTGVTLTNGGPGIGWASAVGNGQAMKEPIGPVAAAPAPAPAVEVPAGPAVVAPADLRRAPEAPALDEALARNYPQDERRQGLTGSAIIRARILPDGSVRPLRVISASRPSFADACRRTLADSRWSQPLDREARPCATDISYTCRFELD
jgi:protein TonB